jgi:hypothetical protein
MASRGEASRLSARVSRLPVSLSRLSRGRSGTQAAFPVAEAARKSLIAHKLELFRIENWFREVGAALRP